MLTSKISIDELKEKLENYKRPKNCDMLSTTKVNPEIWRQMSSGSRSFDLRIQRVQQSLIKGLMPIIDCFQTLLKVKSNWKNASRQSSASDETVNHMTSLLGDSLTLISDANFELNLRRRELIKPELHRDFMPLCSSAPITTFLFGDDLNSQIRNLQQANRIGSLVNRKPYGSREIRRPVRFRPGNDLNRPFLPNRRQPSNFRKPFQQNPTRRVYNKQTKFKTATMRYLHVAFFLL